jgi:hypothetical protein
MMFGADFSSANQERVKAQVDKCAQEKKNLGLPTREGRMSKEKFKTTKQRLVKRFTSWPNRYMSGGVNGSVN